MPRHNATGHGAGKADLSAGCVVVYSPIRGTTRQKEQTPVMAEETPDNPQDPHRPKRPRRPLGQGVPSSGDAGAIGPPAPPEGEEPWEEDAQPGGDEESWGEDEDRDQEPWRQELGEDWSEEDDWSEGYEELEGYAEESWDGSAESEPTETTAAEAQSASDPASASLAEPSADGGAGEPPTRTRPEEHDGEEDEINAATMSLGEHLDELRKRLILAMVGLLIGMVLSLCFGKQILREIERPYKTAMAAARKEYPEMNLDVNLHVLRTQGGFLTYLRVSLISGLILSSPWVFYQLWKFVAAGLYRRERRYVMRAVPFSAILFIGGAMFFLLVISKLMLGFFIHFNVWLELKPTVTQREHIQFMTMLMLVFGLGFQTPLVVFILGKIGLVSLATLRKYRKHVIVLFLIVAALATSPSPIDQIALALPMWWLYELGILLVWLAKRKEAREDKEFEQAD